LLLAHRENVHDDCERVRDDCHVHDHGDHARDHGDHARDHDYVGKLDRLLQIKLRLEVAAPSFFVWLFYLKPKEKQNK